MTLLTLTTLQWTQGQKKFADKVEQKVLKKSSTEKPKILPGKQATRVTSTPQFMAVQTCAECEAQDTERKQGEKNDFFSALNNFLYLEISI